MNTRVKLSDVADESLYLSVPSKNELDLGRELALRFVEEQLPKDFDRVKDYFRNSGAYRRFKELLEDRGQLQGWFAYEAKGVEEALRTWAIDNDIELIDTSDGAAP